MYEDPGGLELLVKERAKVMDPHGEVAETMREKYGMDHEQRSTLPREWGGSPAQRLGAGEQVSGFSGTDREQPPCSNEVRGPAGADGYSTPSFGEDVAIRLFEEL